MKDKGDLKSMRRWVWMAMGLTVFCHGQVISTVAGNGINASTGDGGPALNASFHPNGLTVDLLGNIYIADQTHNRIRKVDTNGIITTVAGTGATQFSGDGGLAVNATVYISANHDGLAVDALGNLYIADDGHHRIRKVAPNGIITTVAGIGTQGYSGDGGQATKAQLYRPSGVAVDLAGNLYIADTNNRVVRKVDTSGIITTLAGTGIFGSGGDGGPANLASFETPTDVAVDALGSVYVADQDAPNVRKINPLTGIITTVAGNATFGFSGDGGPAPNAAFASPYSVTVDAVGNVYISDYGNHRVRKVDTSGIITTVAGAGSSAASNGDGGPPLSANLLPAGVAFDIAGNYYIADYGHNLIRKVIAGAHVPGIYTTASSLYFSTTPAGTPASQIVTVYTTGIVPFSFKFSFSTNSGAGWLNVTSPGVNTPSQLTVSINNIPPVGVYTGTIVLTPGPPDLPVVTIPVTLAIFATAPSRPAINTNGVMNAASFVNGAAANTIVTIKGTNLASVVDTWNAFIASGILPTSLDGVTVLFNGKPGYITYVSPTQINVVAPDISAGTSSLIVSNSGIATTSIFNTPAALQSPAFFTWPGNQAVATRTDYTYAVKAGTFSTLATLAAKPGDVLILWGTGFGPTSPTVPIGIPVPGDATYSSASLPIVTINGVQVTVYGAALAPGYAGLYQVAIQVPSTMPDGDWPLVASIGGVSSVNGVILSVKR
jgi:uncharacterized protein (TIGR03437 family)